MPVDAIFFAVLDSRGLLDTPTPIRGDSNGMSDQVVHIFLVRALRVFGNDYLDSTSVTLKASGAG